AGNWLGCQAASTPTCTASASPTSLASGSAASVALGASCTGSPTTYSWLATSGPVGIPLAGSGASVTAQFPATAPAGTYAFQGTAVNSVGTSTPATVTVTVNAPVAVPQCTLSASPSTTAPGGQVTLRATCNPTATTYNWS